VRFYGLDLAIELTHSRAAMPSRILKNYSVVRLKKPSGAVVFSKTKIKPSQVTTVSLNRGTYAWQVTACKGNACSTSPRQKFKFK
jgi:hypothetical protein